MSQMYGWKIPTVLVRENGGYKACVDYVDNSSSEFHIQDELISLG